MHGTAAQALEKDRMCNEGTLSCTRPSARAETGAFPGTTKRRRRSILEKVRSRFLWIAWSVLFLGVATASAQSPIMIDHTCTDLSAVPDTWIEAAKAQFKASYGHTSHGSQIVTGMNLIKGAPGSLYWFDRDGTAGGLSLYDTTPSGDLGNPDRTTWEARTREMLDAPGNDRNLVIWSWCGQADTSAENMQIYLDLMSGLEADYPDVTFVYMTGHLNGTGEEGNLHQRKVSQLQFRRSSLLVDDGSIGGLGWSHLGRGVRL